MLELNLEIDQGLCFGKDIDRVHRQLGQDTPKTSTGFLADLSEIYISMTHRRPLSRFTASQVLAGIRRSPGYFCQRCQPIEKVVEDWKASNSMSFVASSTALAPFDDLKSAGTLSEHRSAEVIVSSWSWSPEHRDYYYTTMEHSGLLRLEFSKPKLIDSRSNDLPLVQTNAAACTDGLRIIGISVVSE